jgi:uncharacterized protein YqgC (DUF456 family)
MPDVLLYTIAALLILVGVVGTVVPAVPGFPLVFAGMLLASAADGFRRVGWVSLAVLGGLALVGLLTDLLAASLGTRRAGASVWAMVGALAGALAGLPFGLPGLLLGPLAGAVLGELLARRDMRMAGRAGVGVWVGLLAGTVAKGALVVVMLGVFLVALWRE